EGDAVEVDAEVIARGAHELGVDREVAAQLELEVCVVAAQTERAEQDGGGEPLAADAPCGDADREAHGVDAACRAELDVLRSDALGREAGPAQRDLVAEEVRQQRGTPRDELRE